MVTASTVTFPSHSSVLLSCGQETCLSVDRTRFRGVHGVAGRRALWTKAPARMYVVFYPCERKGKLKGINEGFGVKIFV